MHQLSAAGTTLEAEVGDDGATRVVAHVVDPVAVAKVKSQVYRGFSIGGRVTQREAGNPKVITGLVLNEISLVDRPANPVAIFDCWKATTVEDSAMPRASESSRDPEPVGAGGDLPSIFVGGEAATISNPPDPDLGSCWLCLITITALKGD